MNQYNAARAAGYSEATARVKTKNLEERAKIYDVLERNGLTDNVLVKKLIELIEAYDFIEIEKENESVEMVSAKKPNWTARAKGLDLAFKLKNLLNDKIDLTLNKTEKILIVRYDGNKTETMAGQVRVQQEEVPGAVFGVGDGENFRPNLAGNVIQRADTE